MHISLIFVDFAILAGGKSERFGKQKGILPFGEKTLLESIICQLKPFTQDIIIVKKDESEIPYINGARIIKDSSDEQGAIIGIRTALLASREKYCFIFACDMPFISAELIKHMIKMKKSMMRLCPYITEG